MSQIRLVGNLLGGPGGLITSYGHLQLVYYINAATQLEIEVQAPSFLGIPIPYIGNWTYEPVRDHIDNTPHYQVAGEYAYTTLNLGGRSADDVWADLRNVNDEFAAKGTGIQYTKDQNSNSFANTILYVVGIDISPYIDAAKPAEVSLFPGVTYNALTSSTDSFAISLTGSAGKDILQGGLKDDTISTGAGDDILLGAGGNDKLDGGAGIDTAKYSGPAIDYDIRHNTADDTWTISHVRGTKVDGTDTLKNIEFASFSDGNVFSLAKNGIYDQLDLSFVIDTTGSMSPYLANVTNNAISILNKAFNGGKTDARISVVSFKDPDAGDPNTVVLKFTDQNVFADRITAAQNALKSLSASGGGDTPEADNAGLLLALQGAAGSWRDGALSRQIVLFTDAPVKDTGLAATVAKYAHDLGVDVITKAADTVYAEGGTIVTLNDFTFEPDATESDADTIPASAFQVQIYTIQVGSDSTATASVKKIAADNGGIFFQSPSAADLTNTILSALSAPPPASYAITALDAAKAEGNGGSTPFTFTVSRAGDATAAATLSYTVGASGTNAADGSDFVGGALPFGTISFAAGETSKTLSINVAGDASFEADEAFAVTIASAAGAVITAPTSTGTILNDDPGSFSIATVDASKKEGASGTTSFTFVVSRSGAANAAVSVNYAVAGSGTSPASAADFAGSALPSGKLAFAAGETSLILTVDVAGDTIYEPDETFTVSLSAEAGTAISAASAVGTILNDDLPPSFAIAATDANKKEGNTGTTGFTFSVTRTNDLAGTATLTYAVAGTGANPASAADFVGGVLPAGTVTFAAGDTTKIITIPVATDAVVEPDDGFTVTLAGPAGTTITTATAAGTIVNDDVPASYAISATDASRKEGASGTTAFTFTVARAGDPSTAAALTYAVAGSGANPADGADFSGGTLPSGALSFAAGEMSKTLTINVAGDSAYEPDETFTVSLAAATGGPAITGATATGTIQNDDVAGPLLGYVDATTKQSGTLNMDPAGAGGPGYLLNQYIYSGSDDYAFATSAPSVFIHSGSGNDAIQVTSGQNVLDGGLGSNFLTGGSGTDTFFTDARSAGAVWNTIRNFHSGDAATLWGFTSGTSSYTWDAAPAGAAGSEGATLRANIVGGAGRTGNGIDASITFAGLSVEQARNLQFVTGTQPAGNYLFIYNPGV